MGKVEKHKCPYCNKLTGFYNKEGYICLDCFLNRNW